MFNLEKYLMRRGIEYKEIDDDYQLRECPSCGDRRWKFGISKSKLVSHCFVCGAAYNLHGLISIMEDISIRKAKEFVRYYGTDNILSGAMQTKNEFRTKTKVTEAKSGPMTMPKEFEVIKKPVPYTILRRIDLDIVQKYDLRYCSKGKWRNRLIIPVKKDGILYGWQGRDTTGKAKQKIMSCKGFKKSKFVLNYDDIRSRSSAILSEGPFDCMHADPFGAFAIFGKEMSNLQLNLLLNTSLKRIYVGLDPDFPENRRKAAEMLSQFFEVYMLPIPENRDLGEMSEQEIANSVKQAELFNDFNKLS